MKLKRIVAGICAAAMAVTQTAIVPLNVSAAVKQEDALTDYGFCMKVSSMKSEDYAYQPWMWSYDYATADKNAGSVTLSGDDISSSGENIGLKFWFAGSIPEEGSEIDDVYNFTATDLKITASKDTTVTVEAQDNVSMIELGAGHDMSTSLTIPAYSGAVAGSSIKVGYSGADFSNPDNNYDINLTDTNGNALSCGSGNLTDGIEYIITLSEDDAKAIASSGFIIESTSGNYTITSVTISTPEYEVPGVPEEEVVLNESSVSWSQTKKDSYYFDNDQEFTINNFSFENIQDFVDNGSITATWSSLTCQRVRYELEEGDVWAGSTDLGCWSNNIYLSAVNNAEENGILTVEYTVNASDDAAADPVIKFNDSTTDSWVGLTGLNPADDGEGNIYLAADSSSVTAVLTEEAANALKNGCMIISGQDITVTSVKYEAPAAKGSYTVSDGKNNVSCKTWAEVLAAMNDKNADYTITLTDDVTEGNITFPAATNAKSVRVEGNYNTLTIANTALTIPTDVTFMNINLETSDIKTGLTITANRNFVDGNILSATLKTVKGNSNSALISDLEYNNITYSISGFGTVDVRCYTIFNNTVSAAKLVLGDGTRIFVGKNALTFTSIEAGRYTDIVYDEADFTPVTVSGSVTADGPIYIMIVNDDGEARFANGTTVLTAKTADLSKFSVYDGSLPDNKIEYTLAREGSDVKIKGAVYKLSSEGSDPVKYSSWADVVAAMNDNTKDYTITLLADVTEGNITFPAVTKAKSVTVNGNYKVFIVANTALTIPTDVTFKDIFLATSNTDTGLTITASRNFVDSNLISGTLKTVKGNSNSVFKPDFGSRNITYSISGFGTIDVKADTVFNNTVSAAKLVLEDEAAIFVGKDAVTFTSIEAGRDNYIIYFEADFTPVTVSGSVTADGPIYIMIVNDDGEARFANGATVLKAKTAELSKFSVDEGSFPDDEIEYTLAREGADVKIKGAVYKLSSEGSDPVKYSSWADAVAAMNDKNADYTITLLADVTEGNITFPAAAKAKSVTINGNGNTFMIANTALTIPTDVTFRDIDIETSNTKTGLTITASRNFVDGCITSETLKTVRGNSKSALISDFGTKEITYSISGFGTVDVKDDTIFRNTVKATKLVFEDGAAILVGKDAVTFTNIEAGRDAYIIYVEADFTPVTVSGSVTAEEPIYIMLYSDDGEARFANGATVLTAKTADLSKFSVYEENCPESDNENAIFTFSRVGSDVKITEASFLVYTFIVTENDDGSAYISGIRCYPTAYALWSDVLNAVAENSKTNKNDYYMVQLLTDADLGTALTMPRANTYCAFVMLGNGHKLTFNGTNISLTGNTVFAQVELNSVNKSGTSVPFNINAGKNILALNTVRGNINNVTSSGMVSLGGTTIGGSLTANNIQVLPTGEAAYAAESGESAELYSMPSLNSIMAELGVSDSGFESAQISGTGVTVNGALNAKDTLYIEDSLTVKGAFSATGIYTYDYAEEEVNADGVSLVLYKNAKPAVIGKTGFTNGAVQMKFALVDASGKTVEITNDTVIATIAGPYGDNLIPCDKNLDSESAGYYIVKENGKLVAKPKDAENGFVIVMVNDTTSRYTSLEEAIKDINATGAGDYVYTIDLTNAKLSDSYAKLPLPNAGKYDYIVYTANEPVTINVTSDITLTGNVEFGEYVTVNKVAVDRNTKAQTVVPISVNVGKYGLYSDGHLSPKTVGDDGTAVVDRILNISGTGVFSVSQDIVITGRVNVGEFLFNDGCTVTLDGKNASFTASTEVYGDSVFAYDIANAKNVKFKNVGGEQVLTLDITGEVVSGTAVASITGDYTKDMIKIKDSDLIVLRSGNSLIAADSASVAVADSNGKTRIYDSLDSAIKDINTNGKADINYTITLSKDVTASKLLPNAGKFSGITYTAEKPVTINVTSDIILTGSLVIYNNITINKVDRNGKVLPMSVNMGKYSMYVYGCISKDENGVSRIANISGTGCFFTVNDTVVTGKVNVGEFRFNGSTITLEGTRASFAASVYAHNGGVLSYDMANAKNVKFNEISKYDVLTLDITGLEEGKPVAAITGDYIYNKIVFKGSELIAARSDRNLVAVSEDSIVMADGAGVNRVYDSLENAMKDITRIGNKYSQYNVKIDNLNGKSYSKLPLPAAGKYGLLCLYADSPVTINAASDIVLTGDFYLFNTVTINKAVNNKVVPISVNIGNYEFQCVGKLSYDNENDVSQVNNISGKGSFLLNGNVKADGKVNVGVFGCRGNLTLGARSSFSGDIQTVQNYATMTYPVSIAKNVKLGNISLYGSGEPGQLKVQIDGVKAGDQIATLAGDYIAGSVVINDGSLTAVRSGTKLLAVARGKEVTVSDGTNTRAYDTYANAIADITRLANANGEYVITLPEGTIGITKLTLPVKGKYKSIEIKAASAVTIGLTSDVILTGDLIIGENVTMQKGDGKNVLKFTSVKNKDGTPVYTVNTKDSGKLVNATLNGEAI